MCGVYGSHTLALSNYNQGSMYNDKAILALEKLSESLSPLLNGTQYWHLNRYHSVLHTEVWLAEQNFSTESAGIKYVFTSGKIR